MISAIAIAVLSAGSWVLSVAAEAPDIENLKPIEQSENSVVFAADGTRLGVISAEVIRQETKLKKISQDLIDATIAIEDAKFYEHEGVDFEAILRAAIANSEAGEVVQGGSTITQQLVKNLYTGELDDRDLEAKIKEAELAEEVEEKFTKDEILQQYLNTASYGTNSGRTAVGVQAASRQYFSKRASQLNLKQAALLAGLPQAPSLHNPLLNPQGAKKRRAEVLDAMADQGMISRSEATRLSNTDLGVKPTSRFDKVKERYFFDYVTDQLITKYGAETVREGGLEVKTTIDLDLQKQARNAIDGVLNQGGDPASAVVTVDPDNGNVLAMASNANYDDRKFNLAAQGQRQPGSSFKTMVLLSAIERGVDPDSTFYTSKSPLVIKDPRVGEWEVNTFSNSSGGTMNLRRATLASDNVVYAQLDLDIGPENVRKTAYKMGITSELNAYAAEGIGGLEQGVTPLEMANAYATLANGGTRHKANVITKVTFPGGRKDKFGSKKAEREFTDGETNEVTQILKQNVQGGTGTRAQIGCPAAGKTGTTDNFRDAWFVGYTPKLSTSVWVGYPDEQRSMRGVHGIDVAGGTFPAQIWGNYMRSAKGDFCGDFPAPKNKFQPRPFFGDFSRSSFEVERDSSGSTSTTTAPSANTTTGDPDFSEDAYAPGIQDESSIPGNRPATGNRRR